MFDHKYRVLSSTHEMERLLMLEHQRRQNAKPNIKVNHTYKGDDLIIDVDIPIKKINFKLIVDKKGVRVDGHL